MDNAVEGIVGRQANSADHEDSKGNGGSIRQLRRCWGWKGDGGAFIKTMDMTNETSPRHFRVIFKVMDMTNETSLRH